VIHFHYIGYFDPRDPLDLTQMPSPPKPARPVPGELVSRLARRFEVALGKDVEVLEGYLLSHLGHEGELHPFEAALVAEGCVVMSQDNRVVQPREAINAFRWWLHERNAKQRARATE
jgi:hypothetical protein